MGILTNSTISELNIHKDRVVYRQLQGPRYEDGLQKLDEFLREAIGRKFGINLMKLMRKTSQVVKEGKIIDSDRTFFCSELVAKSFKVMGYLGEEKSSCQYHPGNFSAEKDLKLNFNCKLGEELLIDNHN